MLKLAFPIKNVHGCLILGKLSDSSPRYKTLCSDSTTSTAPQQQGSNDMQISEAAGGAPVHGTEPCRFPKLEECAHFHYERVQLPAVQIALQIGLDQSLHSQHTNSDNDTEWFMVQVTSGDECWLVQRNFENFQMLDEQLHQCIFDRKISQLGDLADLSAIEEDLEQILAVYLERLSQIMDNSVNCGPVLNWLQMDNKGHRLLVPSEESRSINTPAVAAAYSIRRYVSQARDELNLEVGDMISVIDMASPGESMWWRGKRGFQVGFFPQHCVHIIGDKVPRNMPLPPPVVGSLALTPIKPVLRKHGKLITFFRSFILNRPSRRRLKQSGILKERVFGCDLGEHLLNTGKDVPTVLKSCAEFIEDKGIVDGIYRLSGITSNIQKLRNAFDEDRIPDLYTEEILKDIHSVASLLKMYFRELPNPLCTYQLYQSFVNAVQGCGTVIRNTKSDHERLLKMREAVQKLPPPHYRTLEYLMHHLARVSNFSTSTGMTTRNLAIVWAPNLLRCEALEIGGVAALQGVGVQAVVTEFLIYYADIIFNDRFPTNIDPLPFDCHGGSNNKENLMMMMMGKKGRPNSLAISSTPTKLITLEEARNKHLSHKTEECNYIEVGGGPSNLPKQYHTIIDLPPGTRKRNHTKRSPLGWRMFFTKSSRNASQGSITKSRKISTPITINEKSVTESDLTDMKRKLRSVKSAESLISGHSEPASNEDVLGPLNTLNKPPGHNRSVSHDSYFDTLQPSRNNSEGSLLDLSEIHLDFDLEESEMRIFSEDESLVSSPRIQRDSIQRRNLTRSRPDDFNTRSSLAHHPSPKKQRVVLSPESASRKRTRLEDLLSDIQYIDCNTPENVVSTTAIIHSIPETQTPEMERSFIEPPKNKSPRNSNNLADTNAKRQSLNLDTSDSMVRSHPLTKSFTDLDINRRKQQYAGNASVMTTPTPGSPVYRQLADSPSAATTTTNTSSPPSEITYQNLRKSDSDTFRKSSPNYENVLTTISITYKSPSKSLTTSLMKNSPEYEDVILNPETVVVIPTSMASLPVQEASQPTEQLLSMSSASIRNADRPKSLSALDDFSSTTNSTLKPNNSSGAICNSSQQLSLNSCLNDQRTMMISDSNQSSGSNIQYTASLSSTGPLPPYHCINNNNSEHLSSSLSEVVPDITDNLLLTTSQISMSTPSKVSPNISPTTTDSRNFSSENLLGPTDDDDDWIPTKPSSINLIEFSPDVPDGGGGSSSSSRSISQNDKRKSNGTESFDNDDNAIYQQVKYFRRSIHEVNALLDLNNEREVPDVNSTNNNNNNNNVFYENVDGRMNDECERVSDEGAKVEELNYDSLESNAYENIEINKDNVIIENSNKTDDETNAKPESVESERFNIKDLMSKFEEKANIDKTVSLKPSKQTVKTSPIDDGNPRLKVFYEKDGGLPPCVRARNLKHQLKTRSLDEHEFEIECGECGNERSGNIMTGTGTGTTGLVAVNQRRQSLDENINNYKSNSLPKTLNPPKLLPKLQYEQIESIHMAHSSSEKINSSDESSGGGGGGGGSEISEEQKKRERIEKYKEERRRILSEKYRSESFKEDKDVLLSRLKIYKAKDDKTEILKSTEELAMLPPRSRRRSSKSDSDSSSYETDKKTVHNIDCLNSLNGKPMKTDQENDETMTVKPVSLKVRAAIFEQNHQKSVPITTDYVKANKIHKDRSMKMKQININEGVTEDESDFIRHRKNKDDCLAQEESGKRRHTYGTNNERESETDKLCRISLDNRNIPGKEKMSPTYCIKDMKAIFESKSKQSNF